ncbi:BED zinc finger family protein [Aphelenchoides avenae]|nr:BED zinc finger family protein [Aphelenchus avenae]
MLGTDGQENKPKKRSRLGGSSVKTAEVWKYFKQLPPPEQAASCDRCHKTIKATNSSTTGMIRHLRSCHPEEYQQLQAARSLNELDKTLKNVPDEAMRDQLRRAYEQSHGAALASPVFQHATMADNVPSQDVPQRETLTDQNGGPAKPTKIHSVESIIGTPMASPTQLTQPPNLPNFHAGMFSPQCLQAFLMETLRSKQQQTSPDNATAHESPVPAPPNVLKRTASLSEDHSELSSPAASRKSSSPKQPKIEPRLERCADEKSEESTPEVDRRKEKPLRESECWPDNHKEAKKLTDQIALMLLLDGLPASVIEGAGFRALLKFFVPKYRIPSEEFFTSKVLPVVRQQLIENNIYPPLTKTAAETPPRHERSGVSPATTIESGFVESDSGHEDHEGDRSSLSSGSRKSETLDNLLSSARAAQHISHEFAFSLDVGQCPDAQLRKELDDSDTSSSVDSESNFQPKMDEFLDFVGRYVFPDNELLDLSLRCYHLYESMDLREQLGLESADGVDAAPHDDRPLLARCIAFVASHIDAINELYAGKPNPPFASFDASDRQFLLDLNAHIQERVRPRT